MSPRVNTRDVVAVARAVQSVCQEMYPDTDAGFVPRAFDWARQCFEGRCPGYRAIDARYHDLEHTLQGTLCMMRLLHGRHLARALPLLSRRYFELGLLAILLHDTGYLKRVDDIDGTGAKYTFVHVRRSIEFAGQFLGQRGISAADIQAVQNMISCTGVNVDLAAIPFQDEAEKIAGFALGTGDLLGQMAADDYVEKLPILYAEFAEARRFSGGNAPSRVEFESAGDLMRKTPAFWEHYVKPKIETDFLRLYQFLNEPFPHGANSYIERIEANIQRLREHLAQVA